MKKKLLLYALVLVLLTAITSAVLITQYRDYNFTYLQYGKLIDEEREILVDRFQDRTAFLYVRNGQLMRMIRSNVIEDGKFYNVSNIWVDGEVVYFERSYHFSGYMEQNYEVCRLNYDDGTIDKIMEITDADIVRLFGEQKECNGMSFSSVNGQLIMDACIYDRKGEMYEYYRCLCQDGEVIDSVLLASSVQGAKVMYDTGDGILGINRTTGVMTYTDEALQTETLYFGLYPYDGEFLARRGDGTGFDLIDPEMNVIIAQEGLYEALEYECIATTEVRDVCKWEDHMLITCANDTETFLAEFQNGELRRRDHVRLLGPLEGLFLCAIVFLTLLVALIVFLVLWKYVISRFVILKMLVVIIPVLLVCDQAAYLSIHKIMNAENEKALEETLTLIATQYESLGLTQKVDDFHNLENPESEDYETLTTIRYLLHYMPNLHTIINADSGIKDDFISITAFYGLDGTTGSFFDLTYGPSYTAEKRWDPGFVRVINLAIEEKETYLYSFYDSEGQYVFCVIHPVFSDTDEVNGFYLVWTSGPEIQAKLEDSMLSIVAYEILLNVIIIAVLFLFMWWILRPLKTLKTQAISLMNGNLQLKKEKKKKLRHVNEISYVERHFYQMAQSVQDNLAEIERLRLSNRQYFSDYLLEALHKKSIALLNFQESETEEYYYIQAYLSEEFASFERYRWFMGQLCTRLDDCQAFVGDLEGRRILILSKNKLLLSVMYYMHQLDGDVYAVFDHARMNVRVVGAGEQFRFSCVCVEEGRTERLMLYREKLSAKLVLTQRVLHELDKNVIHNCIGMIDEEYVYEISVGALNSRKKLISGLLQDAVGSFFLKEYEQARFLFIRVLKTDGENEVARYYIRQMEEGVDK